MPLSKSRYLDYVQCPKKLWLRTNRPELAGVIDQTSFEVGHIVGDIARELFPGGTLVIFDANYLQNIPRMISRTQELIDLGERIIYEAAFCFDGLLAIADILVKRKYGYDIYEVKNSVKIKPINIDDVSFQYYVINQSGFEVANVHVVILDKEYVRSGELEIDKLFKIINVTDKARSNQLEVVERIDKACNVLLMKDHPVVDIGPHCSNPFECPFAGHCWSHIPSTSVFDIQKLYKKFEYYRKGWTTFEDLIKNRVELSEKQLIQVNSHLCDKVYIDIPNIRRFLEKIHYPLVFLDFETLKSAIPLYDCSRAHQQIPTQFSIHIIESKDSALKHFEYLADENEDPRRKLSENLVRIIPENACVLAYYMSFEKTIIKNLADVYPDLQSRLLSIHDSIIDLSDPFRDKYYYAKEMNGSYSIKAVLPALFPNDPELSYENLGTIKNGSEAMNAFPKLRSMTVEERERTRKDLLEYCKLDTLAMVKIWERLKLVTEDI
jgi:hypothetical protein